VNRIDKGDKTERFLEMYSDVQFNSLLLIIPSSLPLWTIAAKIVTTCIIICTVIYHYYCEITIKMFIKRNQEYEDFQHYIENSLKITKSSN
jgi:hypothetical protein